MATELDLNGRAGGARHHALRGADRGVDGRGARPGTVADGPQVARVIYNRLAAGEPLGIDATAATRRARSRATLTTAELEADTPYNTRAQPGLPPTPIASPGRASIEAALNPADGRLALVRARRRGGRRIELFTNDYAEFQAAKDECVEAGRVADPAVPPGGHRRRPGWPPSSARRSATRCRRRSSTPPSRRAGSTGCSSPSRCRRARAGRRSAAMRTLGLGGLSVTMPHKAAASRRGRRARPPVAAELGAVNCVFHRDGTAWWATTPTAPGFVDAPAPTSGLDLAGLRCVVVGAGGAGRAVARALGEPRGRPRWWWSTGRPTRARRAAELAGQVGRVGDGGRRGRRRPRRQRHLAGDGRRAGAGAAARRPGPPARRPGRRRPRLPPRRDPAAAPRHGPGARWRSDGLGMLVHQAAHAFRRWTGEAPPSAP